MKGVCVRRTLPAYYYSRTWTQKQYSRDEQKKFPLTGIVELSYIERVNIRCASKSITGPRHPPSHLSPLPSPLPQSPPPPPSAPSPPP
ncbi:hypothetical protein LshimejAT787_1601260 [Lyophyllum shimeji]|uniref:Uncharacterized protein n=1 Tax=Lyophyllum shimeji TaxID=47721 RepID=A0A9P3PYY4_LYOSH|nr:hypothetical protein LshimejAT787_1601260 [Lyophyllum shimeji]